MYTPSLSSRPQSAPPVIVINGSDSQSPSPITSPITSSAPSMIVVPPVDAYDRSSTTTHVDGEPIVGSRSTQDGQRRLRLVNNLHDIELDIDVDLPRIAVIGSQSSGKSSLIQAVSGIPLLKAPGEACTRCPIECRLSNGTGPWSCRVFLRRIAAGEPPSSPGQPEKEPFGDVIFDPELLEDRIFRAQLAILNPNKSAQRFLNGHVDLLHSQNELTFSPNIICLEITGPDFSDISFVDLPGLIHNVGTSGNPSSITLIEELAKGYISKENCIILVTITCETDFANQGAYELARRYDPQGKRTVGVLTKPDRSPEAAQKRWARYITGEDEQLDHGWFCVKLPDTQSGHPQPSFAGARTEENKWFEKTPPWYGLGREAQNRLGTKKLVAQLEGILSSLIAIVVPQIADQVEELVESTTSKIRKLGKPPSDSVGEMYVLIEQLVREIESGTEKRARVEGNLLYLIENEAVKFKQELRATCPEFRAWNEGTKVKDKDQEAIVPLPELLLEDGEPRPSAERRKIIYLDEVLEKRTRSSARGLPDGGQHDVAEEYLRTFTANWNVPTDLFIKRASNVLREFIQKTVVFQFGRFSHGGLTSHICEAIEVHLQECLTKTREATKLLLKLERNGHTRNERLYRECKDQLLSHLKMQHELAHRGKSMLLDLKRMSTPGDNKVHPSFISSVNSAKAHLGKAGFTVEDSSIAKLVGAHIVDPALEDMAKASAGFEVSLLRFVDYVPLVIDTVLVHGVCDDLANVLRQSFKFSEDNAAERCSYFLQESPETKIMRDQLEQKQVRLRRAAEELRRHGLWRT